MSFLDDVSICSFFFSPSFSKLSAILSCEIVPYHVFVIDALLNYEVYEEFDV